MTGLTGRVLETIRKQELIKAGDRVAVAVSGGADSVALLLLLVDLRNELGIVLSVAHVNHKLRGAESDEDQRFVEDLARRNGLELLVRTAPLAKSPGVGIEAAARKLRYEFFRDLALKGSAVKIATAHTLDDQAETVLLRIFRGTGIRGLAGILPRLTLENEGVPRGEVVRPLLGVRREELREFVRERGQAWREDSSNLDTDFLRNKMRLRVLPALRETFGESAFENLADIAEIARAEEEAARCLTNVLGKGTASAVPSKTEKHAGFSRWGEFQSAPGAHQEMISGSQSPLSGTQSAALDLRHVLALPLASQRRLVRSWIEVNAPEVSISFRLIEAVLELAQAGKGRLELCGTRALRAARGELRWEGAGAPAVYEYVLPVNGRVEVHELGTRIEAVLTDWDRVPDQDRSQLLDPEKVQGEMRVRNWRPGDRFCPANTKQAKKVKELLSERHAVGIQKKLWPVVEAGGELVWMQGFAAPETLRPALSARKVLWIHQASAVLVSDPDKQR